MILITGGLIWSGMGLFREFERKHADTPAPLPTAIAEPPAKEGESREEQPAATEGQEPPRRAIIVREEE
jgi:hypothetical protein